MYMYIYIYICFYIFTYMFISYKIKKQNRKIDNKENEIVIKLLRRFTAFRK